MLRLIETNLFTPAEIQDELTFNGMRPTSQQRMIHAAPYLATQPERHALRATIEKVYIAGLSTDTELTAAVDSSEQNTDRDALILQRCQLEKLLLGVKDLEAEYTSLYLGQLIDDSTYRNYLTGIGLQADSINFLAGKAEARLNVTLHKKALADAAALERATAKVERATALQNYLNGSLPLLGYTAALIATGLTATQAAAWTDLAALKKAGNVRWVFGQQLEPAAATVLKQRVAALTDQRKKQLITQQAYVQALGQLGLSDTWINALDAAAEALLTPKKSAFGVSVQTS
jgi:hypothetical protein